MKLRHMILTGALAGLGLLPRDANAFSNSNSGATCVRTSGGSMGFFGATISNLSTSSTMKLLCPVTSYSPIAGSDLDSATAYVFDRNDGANVSCTMTSEILFEDTILSESETKSTSGFSTSVKTLTFGDQGGGYAYLYMTCSVPPMDNGWASHMGSYDVRF